MGLVLVAMFSDQNASHLTRYLNLLSPIYEGLIAMYRANIIGEPYDWSNFMKPGKFFIYK